MRTGLVLVLALAALSTAGVLARGRRRRPSSACRSSCRTTRPSGARLFVEKQCVRATRSAPARPASARISDASTSGHRARSGGRVLEPRAGHAREDAGPEDPAAPADQPRDGGPRRVPHGVPLLPHRGRAAGQSRRRAGGLRGQGVPAVPRRRRATGTSRARAWIAIAGSSPRSPRAGDVESRPRDGAASCAAEACRGRSSRAARWAICSRICRPATKASRPSACTSSRAARAAAASSSQTKRCIACHAIAGVGGHGGPDLGTRGRELVGSISSIAGLMWNHSQGMTAEFARRGIPRVTFSGQEMADIIAYLYFVNYANVYGAPDRGERIFAEKCSACHTIGGGKRSGRTWRPSAESTSPSPS